MTQSEPVLTSEDRVSDVDRARRLLAEAEEHLAAAYGRNLPSVALASACATIGTGYAVLAGLKPDPPVLGPAIVVREPLSEAVALRDLRAADEARPHDGEPAPEPVAEKPAPKPVTRRKAAGRG